MAKLDKILMPVLKAALTYGDIFDSYYEVTSSGFSVQIFFSNSVMFLTKKIFLVEICYVWNEMIPKYKVQNTFGYFWFELCLKVHKNIVNRNIFLNNNCFCMNDFIQNVF